MRPKQAATFVKAFARSVRRQPSRTEIVQKSKSIVSSSEYKSPLVVHFENRFGADRLNRMYFPIVEKKVEKVRDGEIRIVENEKKIDVEALLVQEIGDNLEKAVAFLKFRNFALTDLELKVLLPVLLKHKNALLESNPDALFILQDCSLQIEFDTLEDAADILRQMGHLLAYTTKSKLIESLLEQINSNFENFWVDDDCYVKNRLDILLNIAEDVFKHVYALQLLDPKNKVPELDSLSFTQSYAIRDFFLNLHSKTRKLTLEQALRLLDSYYNFALLPAIEKEKKSKVSHRSDAGEEFEETITDTPLNIPLMEYLDVVFCEFEEKLTFLQLSHILYTLAKCKYTTNRLLSKFSVRYFTFLKRNEEYISSKDIMIRLFWALSQSNEFKDQNLVFKVLELQMLRYNTLSKINFAQKIVLIGCFNSRKMGSLEFWTEMRNQFLKDFGLFKPKTHAQKIQSYRYLMLLLHNCVRVGIEDDSTMDNLAFTLPYIRDYLAELTKDDNYKPDEQDKQTLNMIATLLISHLYNKANSIIDKDIELCSECVESILRFRDIRNLVGKSKDTGPLILLVLEILQINLSSKVLQKKAMLDKVRADGTTEITDIVFQKDLKTIYERSAKMLYNLDINKENLDQNTVILIWLKLGDIHLKTYPNRLNYFTSKEEFEFEHLVIKRRVFHNFIIEDLMKNCSVSAALSFLEIFLLSNFFDEKIGLHLQIKVSQGIDQLEFDEVIKAALILSQFSGTTPGFYFLIQTILEESISEDGFRHSSEFRKNLERIESIFAGKIDFEFTIQYIEEQNNRHKNYGLDPDLEENEQFALVNVQTQSEKVVGIILLKFEDELGVLDFEEEREWSLTISEVIDYINTKKDPLNIDWKLIRRSIGHLF